MGEPDQSINALLDQLNHWEQNFGNTYGAGRGLATTGEANARIGDLKQQLIARGVVFHWNGRAYLVDRLGGPGQGRQDPDTEEAQG